MYASAQTDTVLYHKQPAANGVLAARLQPIKGEKQYITAELIRIQGIVRLSELITWIDKATFSTVQHDRFYLNINGTSTIQQQQVVLMINGQKVELERWDALHLDLLGVVVTDIAYVEVVNTPRIINGQFSGKGAINIVTRTDHTGLTASGYVNHGNPVGDPGPAAFINGYATPNVDRVGSVAGYTLGYYGKKGHINLSYNNTDWYIRDSSATNRLARFATGIRQNTRQTSRLEAVLGLGNHYLIEAGGAWSEEKGFVYRNYLQSEVPSNTTYGEARTRITRSFKNQAYVRSGITLNSQAFGGYSSLYRSYTYYTASANAEYGNRYTLSRNRHLSQASGYTLDYKRYSTGSGIQLQHKPYTTLTYQPTKKITRQLDLSLDIFNGTVNPAIAFKREKNSSIINGSSFVVSYRQTRLNTQFDQLWQFYYTNRNSVNQAAYPVSFSHTPTHQFTADYFYFISSGGNFRININPGIRYQSNYRFIRLSDSANTLLSSQSTTGTTAGFYTITFGTNIHYDVFTNFWFDLDYYSANDKSSNKELQQVLNSDARRKIALSFYLKLPARMDIGIRSQAISKTSWTYFDHNNQRVTNTVPSVFTTDFSVNKKLWGDRLYVNATIRNIFNQREQYIPIGADFQMRFFVTATVMLDNLLKYLPKQ